MTSSSMLRRCSPCSRTNPAGTGFSNRFPAALISSVNLSEVVAKLAELGMPESEIRLALSLGLEVVPFDEALAFSAGALRPVTRSAGLSLGDRACLALARSRALPALTTDRAWRDIDIDVEVEVIRPD